MFGNSTISVHANMNEIYCDRNGDDVLGSVVTVIDDDYRFDLFRNKNALNDLYKCLVLVRVDVMLLNSQHVCDGCQFPFQCNDLWQW